MIQTSDYKFHPPKFTYAFEIDTEGLILGNILDVIYRDAVTKRTDTLHRIFVYVVKI